MAIVIRAHNEEDTVVSVVEALHNLGEPVWVAASGCTDNTVEVSLAAGAKVLSTPLGLGASTIAALHHFAGEPVVFIDGDLTSVRVDVVKSLLSAAEAGLVGKGVLDTAGRSSSQLPIMAESLGIELPEIPPQALTTAYSSYPANLTEIVDLDLVPMNQGSDLMLSLLVHRVGVKTVVIPAGPRAHRNRGEAHVENLIVDNLETLKKFASLFPRN